MICFLKIHLHNPIMEQQLFYLIDYLMHADAIIAFWTALPLLLFWILFKFNMNKGWEAGRLGHWVSFTL